MKPSDFTGKLNEVDLSDLIGDYGAAGARQIGNRMFGKGGRGDLSVRDRMVYDRFIRDFIGRATYAVDSGLKSGLLDPMAKGFTAQQQPQVSPPAPPAPPAPPQGNQPQQGTPDYFAAKRAAAAKAAQADMVPFSKLPQQPQPGTPEYFAAKRKAAAQAAQDSMVPFSKLPADQYAKTAANIRQQKQAQAGQAAQADMVPFSKLPADQYAKTAANIRQQKQAQAAQAAQASMTPAPASFDPTKPAPRDNAEARAMGFRNLDHYRQELQAYRIKNAKFDPSKPAPKDNAEARAMGFNNLEHYNQVRQAAGGATNDLKNRLKSGQGIAKQTGSGFSNYVKAGGQRLTGADAQGNPVFKSMRESYYSRLDYLFESIINLDEQENVQQPQQVQKRSIAQQLYNYFVTATGIKKFPPDVTQQIKTLANAAQANWKRNKGYNELNQLANLAYTISKAQDPADDKEEKQVQLKSEEALGELNKLLPLIKPEDQKALWTQLTTKQYKPPTEKAADATTEKPKTEPEKGKEEPAANVTGQGTQETPPKVEPSGNVIQQPPVISNVGGQKEKEKTKDEPISIGGQKLDPKNPKDAELIDKIKQTQTSAEPGKGIKDIANKAKASTNPEVEKRKQEMMKLTGGRGLVKGGETDDKGNFFPDGTLTATIPDPKNPDREIKLSYDKDYNLLKQEPIGPESGEGDVATLAPPATTTKPHTGGRAKGAAPSMTPNAIRKRNARAAIRAGIEAAKAKPKKPKTPSAYK